MCPLCNPFGAPQQSTNSASIPSTVSIFYRKRKICTNCAAAFSPSRSLDFAAPQELRDAASKNFCCLDCMWSASFRRKDEACYARFQMGSPEETPPSPGIFSAGSSMGSSIHSRHGGGDGGCGGGGSGGRWA